MVGYTRIEAWVAGVLASIAAALLCIIVLLFVGEIGMRYLLNSPTKWSNDAVGFVMPAMVFLALPEVTRRNQHIAIMLLVEITGERTSAIWSRVLCGISAALSAVAFWVVFSTVIKQFERGIMSNTVVQAPKWMLSAPIAVGFIVMAVIFLATALGVRRDHGLA